MPRYTRTPKLLCAWASPVADELDRVSLEQWLRSLHAGASTRDLMAIMSRVTWGAEPDAVSMLHAVRYVKAAGGLNRMLDVEGGAQQDRYPGGTQQIAVRMADALGERVRLDAGARGEGLREREERRARAPARGERWLGSRLHG